MPGILVNQSRFAPPGAEPLRTQAEFVFERDKVDLRVLADKPEFLRADQVASILNCTTEHIRHLREKGAIEARDIRSPGAQVACYRYYRDSVRAYLTSRPNGRSDYY